MVVIVGPSPICSRSHMRDGRFVQVGTPQEVVTEPADDYVRNFVRDIPRSHVVPVEAVMSSPHEANGTVAGEVVAGTKVRDVVGLLADSDLPVAVVDVSGARIGIVTRADALGVIAGEDA